MHPFPFSSIVGQEALKRALLLCVIEPRLGGVLVRGAKGVAKSTAVRALAGLLPPIETVQGCPFNRVKGQEIAAWPLPADAAIVQKQVPLIELPIGATEDRVLGSIHLERAIQSGRREFEPGLLAAANRGILYVDEVNLLPDHLVDVLLDAAASGEHRLEREGISLVHPAEFVLVGTMNPEEGELRPQLLDRFGLVVDVGDLDSAELRAEAVRRRLAYELDGARFLAEWRAHEAAEAERIVAARQLLPQVRITEERCQQISRRCLEAGAEGLRADLTVARAARAWAAYQGRTAVTEDDAQAVEDMALAHRRTRPPEPPPKGGLSDGGRKDQGQSPNGGPATAPQGTQVHDIASGYRPRALGAAGPVSAGRISFRTTGPATGARVRLSPSPRLDLAGTLRAAAPSQRRRSRSDAEEGLIRLRPQDLRWRERNASRGLVLFLIDASGSMASRKRMRQTKAAIWALARDLLGRGGRAAMLAFRDQAVEQVLAPTRSRKRVREALERLPVGGVTPLAAGLLEAAVCARRWGRAEPVRPVRLVLLTDGRGNVSCTGDPWRETLDAARRLAIRKLHALVIDTETSFCRLGLARDLAEEMAADYTTLDDLLHPCLQGSSGTGEASGVWGPKPEACSLRREAS